MESSDHENSTPVSPIESPPSSSDHKNLNPISSSESPPSSIDHENLNPISPSESPPSCSSPLLPATPAANHQPLLLNDRFGKYCFTVIVAGTPLVVGCMAFLSLLWLGDERSSLWRRIVMAGWVTRSITVTALVIRVVTGAQAAVTTSMVAALLLRSSQTRLSSAAAVTTALFSNSGPQSLILHLPRRRQLTEMGTAMWVVVSITMAISLALQFTSTALLSDVGRGTIQSSEHYLDRPYAVTRSASGAEIAEDGEFAGWMQEGVRPIQFRAFAEHAEPRNLTDGVSDTNRSLRAFLPIFNQSSLESTLSYEGLAVVADTRVVCRRPVFENLTIFANPDNTLAWGSARPEVSVPWLIDEPEGNDSESFRWAFNCSFAVVDTEGSSYLSMFPKAAEWPITLCSDYQSNITLDPTFPRPTLPTLTFLVFNTTGLWFTNSINLAANITIVDFKPSGDWTTMITNDKRLTISASLCSTRPEGRIMDITATRARGSPEPSATWLPLEAAYDTAVIRKQLGLTNAPISLDDRGIFDLTRWSPSTRAQDDPSLSKWVTSAAQHVANATAPFWLDQSVKWSLFRGGDGRPFCGQYCVFRPRTTLFANGTSIIRRVSNLRSVTATTIPMHIFQHVIQDTGSLALAMQAFITVVLETVYADYSGSFDATAPALIKYAVEVDKPVGWTFAIIISALLFLHLFFTIFVALLFGLIAPDCVLGGAWAAVSMIRGEETDEWLAIGSRVRDSGMSRNMKEKGDADVLLGFRREGNELRLRKIPSERRTSSQNPDY